MGLSLYGDKINVQFRDFDLEGSDGDYVQVKNRDGCCLDCQKLSLDLNLSIDEANIPTIKLRNCCCFLNIFNYTIYI